MLGGTPQPGRLRSSHLKTMSRRTARITIETERLLVISRSRSSIKRWCEACNANTEFIGIDEAAAIAGVSQRTIFRWAEAEALHLIETSDGKAMFCLQSIARQETSSKRKLLRS